MSRSDAALLLTAHVSAMQAQKNGMREACRLITVSSLIKAKGSDLERLVNFSKQTSIAWKDLGGSGINLFNSSSKTAGGKALLRAMGGAPPNGEQVECSWSGHGG